MSAASLDGFVIRQVGPDDWADWRTVRQRSLTEDPHAFASSITMWTGDNDTPQRWQDRLDTDDPCFIAYVDGAPVGMIATSTNIDAPADLISMWVAPEVRGRGIGGELVRLVIVWAAGRPLKLRVMDGNAAATALYEAHGFVLSPAGPDNDGCRSMLREG